MKTRMSVIGATFAMLFAGSAFGFVHSAEVSMTIDDAAPVRATLLPTVSVEASAKDPGHAAMRIADVAPLEVTLLPTVHVTARGAPDLATTLLPTVRVTAPAATASQDEDVADIVAEVPDLPSADAPDVASPHGLRAGTMPR
jgi:hypothetical protein